ncbi:MAG: hypothetical protein ACYC27_12865 [Armatimonadota bacterium]
MGPTITTHHKWQVYDQKYAGSALNSAARSYLDHDASVAETKAERTASAPYPYKTIGPVMRMTDFDTDISPCGSAGASPSNGLSGDLSPHLPIAKSPCRRLFRA